MKSEFERTAKMLEQLEADDNRHGLTSCFGLTPIGEVIYFDEVGSPCRAHLAGNALVRGKVVNLGTMPVQVISTEEAFQHISQRVRQEYNNRYQAQVMEYRQRQVARPRQRRSLIAAAGLVIILVFGVLVWQNAWNIPAGLSQAEANLKNFYGERGVNIGGYKDVPMIVQPGSYNPLGPVSISREVFQEFLSELNSPALPEAATMYQTCLEEGCDPALALAFFEHESSAGKQGVAAYTKSLGNIRCTSGYDCFSTEGNGSFRRYKTWSDGLRDWAKLMQYYKDEWKRVSLEDIVPKYAPQADNNNEAAYIAMVKQRVDNLRKRESSLAAAKNGELPIGNPVYEDDMVITQGFHAKHPAIDIARPAAVALGTKIHTTISGVVTVVRNDPLYGNRVFVNNGVFTAQYNHLTDEFQVQNGQVVKRGDVIGLMGNTGNSTGPHLDYQLYQGKQLLNPMDWVYRRT